MSPLELLLSVWIVGGVVVFLLTAWQLHAAGGLENLVDDVAATTGGRRQAASAVVCLFAVAWLVAMLVAGPLPFLWFLAVRLRRPSR